MAATERIEKVRAHDDGTFDGLTVVPEGGSGSGVLLLQEIFGVNDYVRAVAERLAGMGYVVLAPDLFWRIEPRIALGHDPESVAQARSLAQRFDFAAGVRDCGSSLEALRSLPEMSGGAGVIGFCFGGTLAFHTGVAFCPDALVSYYGSGVPDALDRLDELTCPALFHFGDEDPSIPRERLERVLEVLEQRPQTEVYVYEGAAHAFDNHLGSRFHAAAAAAAWERTQAFLRRHL